MKKKELDEMKNKTIAELGKKLVDLSKQMIDSKIQLKAGKLKNVHQAGNLKKDIARIKSIIQIKSLIQTASKKDKNNVAI